MCVCVHIYMCVCRSALSNARNAGNIGAMYAVATPKGLQMLWLSLRCRGHSAFKFMFDFMKYV